MSAVPTPMPRRRTVVRALAAAAGVVPLAGCAWLDDQQRRLALRPTPGRPAGLGPDEALFRPGDERFTVAVPARAGASAAPDQLALWWLPQRGAPRAPALLYLHGTFRNLYQNLPKIDALRAIGFAVLAVDYRGWGDSTPIVPDEVSIADDARVAFDELRRRQPDAARRVIYGHSMGGAVAVRLAAGLRGSAAAMGSQPPPRDYAALVLESTFTRMPDVAASAGAIGRLAAWLTSLEFDSAARIARVDAPILMIHGDADTTVPIALGRRLRDAARPGAVRWVEIAGGSHSRLHSDAPDRYRPPLEDLLRQLDPPPPAALKPPPLLTATAAATGAAR